MKLRGSGGKPVQRLLREVLVSNHLGGQRIKVVLEESLGKFEVYNQVSKLTLEERKRDKMPT